MKSSLFANVGRVSLSLAFVSLLGAWWTQISGETLLGLSQQHLFLDAAVLALLGIGSLVDGIVHRQAAE